MQNGFSLLLVLGLNDRDIHVEQLKFQTIEAK